MPLARPYCSFVVESRPDLDSIVVEYHKSKNTTGGWKYGKKADSDFEIGVQKPGENWTASGNVHVSTGRSTSSGLKETDKAARGYYGKTEMEYVKGITKAYGAGTGQCQGTSVYPGTRHLIAVAWNGGATRSGNLSQYDCNDKPQKDFAVNMAKGGEFTTESSKAEKYEYAADFKFVMLGGSSGFSESVELTWSWDHGAGKICGKDKKPARGPSIFYVN